MPEIYGREYLIALRQILDARFSEEELRTLCFDIGVDYDNLPGEGKAGKAREIIGYLVLGTKQVMHRHNHSLLTVFFLSEVHYPEVSYAARQISCGSVV